MELVGKTGAIDTSLAAFAINSTLACVGALIISAEFHLSFVAKYWGFLALRKGCDITLICTGLVLFAWSRPQMSSGETDLSTSAIFCTVAGVYALVVGVTNLGLSMVPPCFDSMLLPPDSLAEYFRAIHENARLHKVKKNLTKDLESAGTSHAKETFGGDLEAGKSAANSKPSKATKESKKSSKAAQAAPASENPFINRNPSEAASIENPFMQPVSRV